MSSPSVANGTDTDPASAAQQSIMTGFSSLLLLGSYAVQAVLGRPDASRVRREGDIIKRSVDSLYVSRLPTVHSLHVVKPPSNFSTHMHISKNIPVATHIAGLKEFQLSIWQILIDSASADKLH